jgi:hypothetical protein
MTNKENILNLQKEFRKRKSLMIYARLMKLKDARLDDIKANPEKHIKRLCLEVERLRSVLDKIDKILHPGPTMTPGGNVVYPEHIDIGALAVTRLFSIETLIYKYFNSEPIGIEDDTDETEPDTRNE